MSDNKMNSAHILKTLFSYKQEHIQMVAIKYIRGCNSAKFETGWNLLPALNNIVTHTVHGA